MNTVVVDGKICRELTCDTCKATFTKPLKRGPVHKFCDSCNEKKRKEKLLALLDKKKLELPKLE